MKKCLKFIFALVLSMFIFTSTAAPAPITASECGLKIIQNKTYTKDNKLYMSFKITTGRPPETEKSVTFIKASVVNSSGKTIFTWSEKEFAEYTTFTRNYGADYRNLPSGTYTFYLTVTIRAWSDGGYIRRDYPFNFSSNITHKQPAVIKLNSAQSVANEDGTYSTKISFSHTAAKGKKISFEVYNTNGKLVFKTSSSKTMTSDSGTYNFKWNGYPIGGGLKCPSDDYIIKYWLTDGNAKQSTVHLKIY